MQLFHCRSSERYSSYQHHVEADACAPHVRFEAFVASASYNFWSYVRWSSTLFLHVLFIRVDLPRDTKITNFDSSRLIKQNIIKLDISMHNEFLRVDIIKSFNHHLEQKLGVILLQLPSFPHIAEQISALAEFHDKANMLICFKRIIHPDNTVMATLFQDRHFLHHASLLFFLISQNFFLDRLDGHQVFRYLVACQIDFPKGSSSQHTTNSIELTCWSFHAWVFIKVKFNHLLQFRNVFVVLVDLLLIGTLWFHRKCHWVLSGTYHRFWSVACRESWRLVLDVIFHLFLEILTDVEGELWFYGGLVLLDQLSFWLWLILKGYLWIHDGLRRDWIWSILIWIRWETSTIWLLLCAALAWLMLLFYYGVFNFLTLVLLFFFMITYWAGGLLLAFLLGAVGQRIYHPLLLCQFQSRWTHLPLWFLRLLRERWFCQLNVLLEWRLAEDGIISFLCFLHKNFGLYRQLQFSTAAIQLGLETRQVRFDFLSLFLLHFQRW